MNMNDELNEKLVTMVQCLRNVKEGEETNLNCFTDR